MSYEIRLGDVLDRLGEMPDASVQCCVTSPPYWGLRDYGVEGQIGLEESPDAYVERMVEVFREVRRVLREDGTLWLNVGDSYAAARGYQVPDGKHKDVGNDMPAKVPHGLKPKDLCLIPYRLVLALQADSWWVRSQIVWAKKSSMPESVRDRPTSAWEPIFLLTKSQKYYYDAEAVRTPHAPATNPRPPGTRDQAWANAHIDGPQRDSNGGVGAHPSGANLRNVWHLGPEPFPDAHFATFPTEIPRKAISAGTSAKGCCPECGAPWGREVERDATGYDGSKYGERAVAANAGSGGTAASTLGSSNGKLTGKQRTTGWRPTCNHSLDPIPCTVLDPFAGSGTTLLVAEQLSRNSIGIELNPDYAQMAEKRIQAGLPVTRRRRRGDEGGFALDYT